MTYGKRVPLVQRTLMNRKTNVTVFIAAANRVETRIVLVLLLFFMAGVPVGRKSRPLHLLSQCDRAARTYLSYTCRGRPINEDEKLIAKQRSGPSEQQVITRKLSASTKPWNREPEKSEEPQGLDISCYTNI
jgi:hypothetical protein